jgi:hypothetical protein
MAPGGPPGPATTHPGTPAGLAVTGARRVALFASGLQRSDAPTTAMAAEAITATVRRFGIKGCLTRMAQEFGDHPDTAAARMRWICQLTAQVPDWPQRPAGAGRPGNRASNEIQTSSDHYRTSARGAA